MRVDSRLRRRRRVQRARPHGRGGVADGGAAAARGRPRRVRVEVRRRAGRRGGHEVARERGTCAAVRAGEGTGGAEGERI